MLYTFGAFTLDDQLYQLHHAGQLVKVEPKAFNLLVYLVTHRDQVVSRDELFTQLWPDQVVSDAALTYCVATARKAVHDNGVQQRLIKTEHSRGYRFVESVTVSGQPDVASPVSTVASPSPPFPYTLSIPWKHSRLALMGLLLIVGWIVIGWQLNFSPIPLKPPEQAVQAHHTPFAQEDIRRWWMLKTEHSIAWEYLLQGWEAVSASFTPERNAKARQRFRQALAIDPHYAAAHVGLGWTYWRSWWLGAQKPEDLAQAVEQAQFAVASAPDYPYAYLFLADVYLMQKDHAQAITAAEQAIALDAVCARCYATLARMLSFAGQAAEALPLIEQARQLDPLSAPYYAATAGHAYRLLGHHGEAIEALEKALSHDANFVFAAAHLATVYSELQRLEDAQAIVQDHLSLLPRASLQPLSDLLPYRDPQETERVLAALQQAGLQ